jgi:uncharacterized protein involved in outer membrane biogenesis
VRILKWAGGFVLLLVVALVLFIAYGLNSLRGPLTHAVTNATGRELRVEGDLKPLWGWLHPRFRAEKVSFANPDWASQDYMFRADALEAPIAVLPLIYEGKGQDSNCGKLIAQATSSSRPSPSGEPK